MYTLSHCCGRSNVCFEFCFVGCLIQNDFGDTALVTAVDKGYTEIVEILVKAGANVNFRNKVRPLMTNSH